MFPSTLRTHGSILYSHTKVGDIPQICSDYGFISAPLTDIESMSQCVQYYKTMKDAKLKPVLGCTFNWNSSDVIIYAKNLQGWKDLLQVFFQHQKDISNKSTFNINNLDTSNILVLANDNNFKTLNSRPNVFKYFNVYSKDHEGIPVTANHYRSEFRQHNAVLRSLHNNIQLAGFADGNVHDFIHTKSDLLRLGVNPTSILEATKLFDLVEEFDITRPADLPQLSSDSNKDIRDICYKYVPDDPVYKDRLEHELSMIKMANMSSYFLIVKDILDYIRNLDYFVGVGRGSVGGSLVAYLLNITNTDPIKYGLIFERFYTPDRASLPDIDIDIQPESRDAVVQYLKNKYGQYNFAQVLTFNTLKGKESVKSVLRASNKNVSFTQQNTITKSFPFDESKIIDELVDQQKLVGTKSMVYWMLKNQPDRISRWCRFDGTRYDGEFAEEFKLAVELDATIASQGRHASAFALSNKPLYEYAPVVWDNHSEEYILGVDMYSMEHLGVIKLDLLGLALLSKCKYMTEIINGKRKVLSPA